MTHNLQVDIEVLSSNERFNWQKPQCQCDTVQQIAPPNRLNRRCKHVAVYVLNGTKLCERHAGRELLRLLLNDKVPHGNEV